MPFPTPFDHYRGRVLPAWIDANDHMNLAYYVVLFDLAGDLAYERFCLGPQSGYKERTNFSTMAVESHNLYVQELLLDEEVRVVTQILAVDDKRIHMAHEMYRLPDNTLAAMQELMLLHVDLGRRKVTPWPADIRALLDEAAEAHKTLKVPDWVGRRIAMPVR